ncbi:MAG: hypothetical protein FWC51_03555 [Proteobacteria bacterium]|nr:hypothetical protein [Pseudomonadota bacterium]
MNTIFNPAREAAIAAFLKTLSDMDQKIVTEIEFRDMWLRNIAMIGTIIADGWYNPPPRGAAVLFGPRNNPDRISFTSLRAEKFWPTHKNTADWKNGFIYAYCSPVHKETGIIGDVSFCLYLGKDKRLRDHFINAHTATAALLAQLPTVSNSLDLFKLSQTVFADYNLANNIASINDPLNNNIGHTFPSIGPIETKTLTQAQKDRISHARRFINGGEPFDFADGMQFTIEPQLTSVADPTLPKVTLHYLAQKVPNGFNLCTGVDILSAKYGLVR